MQQLIYTLLAYLNNSIIQDINYHIAKNLLENINIIKTMSLEDLTVQLNVSSRTVNRFCQKIGYHNFSTLRKFTLQSEKQTYHYEQDSASFHSILLQHFKIIDQITQAEYIAISQMINAAHHIYIIGFEKHQMIALEFQKQLFELGKICKCTMNYYQQFYDIENSTSEDLIIYISIKGIAVTHNGGFYQCLKKSASKKILITFNPNLCTDCFDQTILCGDLHHDDSSEYALLRFFNLLINQYHIYKTGLK